MNIGPIKTGDLITVYGHPDNDVPKNEDFDGMSGLCLGYALDGMAGTVEIIVQFPDTFTIFQPIGMRTLTVMSTFHQDIMVMQNGVSVSKTAEWDIIEEVL